MGTSWLLRVCAHGLTVCSYPLSAEGGKRWRIGSDRLRSALAWAMHPVDGLLPPQPGREAGQPAFLLQARPDCWPRCGRSARRSAAISASRSSSVTAICSRRATSSSTSAGPTASAAGVALALAELVPVDVGLPRIDLLLHQAARELLEPAVDLALDQRARARANGTRAASCFSTVARAPRARPRAAASCSRSCAHARAQRVERLEVAQVLGELVVERRHHALLDLLDRHRVGHGAAGQLGDAVVVGVGDREALVGAVVQADQLVIEAGRVRRARRARSDTWSCLSVGPCTPALSVPWRSRSTTTVCPATTAPAFDRLEARGALAQPLERLFDGLVLHGRRRALGLDGGEVARVELAAPSRTTP